jgi:serine/threonine protein kinase
VSAKRAQQSRSPSKLQSVRRVSTSSSCRGSALVHGAIVAERFRALSKIAAGAMGEVWAGEHVQLRTRVAIKVLLREASESPEVVSRFSREALLLGQIHSDHVVRAYDFVSDGRYGPVLVMELVDGQSLADILASRRFTVEQGIELGIEIAGALREIHEANVVHRDVKPANIILKPVRHDMHRAVFVDLGVGRCMTGGDEIDEELMAEITTVDRAVGTPEYMAPEQILSSRTVLPAADVYALGAILFRAVAGRHVFDEVQGRELLSAKLTREPSRLVTGRVDRVAAGFEEVVARALACEPADRYEVADEMLVDLSLLRDAARRAARRPASRARVSPSPAPWAAQVRSRTVRTRATSIGRALVFGAALVAGALVGGMIASSAAPALLNHAAVGGAPPEADAAP